MRRTSLHRAFTLVELLVVIGIIALLISILLPVLNKAQEAGRRTACLSGIRQLTIAWIMYSDDHRDAMVKATVGTDAWVLAENTDNAMKKGLLWKYARSLKIYHCPGDEGMHKISYSINCWLNGENYFGTDGVIKKRGDIGRDEQTFVFIEENDFRGLGEAAQNHGYNQGSFAVQTTGTNWVDYPGAWHNKGACLSFGDGHAEYWPWVDRETPLIKKNGAPGKRDLKRLQAAVKPK